MKEDSQKTKSINIKTVLICITTLSFVWIFIFSFILFGSSLSNIDEPKLAIATILDSELYRDIDIDGTSMFSYCNPVIQFKSGSENVEVKITDGFTRTCSSFYIKGFKLLILYDSTDAQNISSFPTVMLSAILFYFIIIILEITIINRVNRKNKSQIKEEKTS